MGSRDDLIAAIERVRQVCDLWAQVGDRAPIASIRAALDANHYEGKDADA